MLLKTPLYLVALLDIYTDVRISAKLRIILIDTNAAFLFFQRMARSAMTAPFQLITH
jgi:hypothetical protein